MVGTLVHQLTDGASAEEMKECGVDPYYTDHGWGSISSSSCRRWLWNAANIAVKGDPIADLQEDLVTDK